ncbi:MAG: pantetheine-phosphate adenylyltransferase [Actinobacteria bacterium]|nr:pantetheine-phosphate adenylyltransferase [Actinomycetota bacterium]
MTQAIYPGTFDPITHGHTDLVQRASRLFDRVVVAVAGSTWKQTTFTLEERVALVRVALDGIERVEVHSFEGLLVETARSLGTTVILRGLRVVSDFEYELQMASMNRRLVSEVDTLFLTPSEHYAYLSASLVREIASLGGDVGPFVHPEVASALVAKLRAGKC